MNWQPIETAPKEPHARLLLWERWMDEPFVGYWLHRSWHASGSFYSTDGDANVVDLVDSSNVTHWMPLPAPPEQGDGA